MPDSQSMLANSKPRQSTEAQVALIWLCTGGAGREGSITLTL